MWWVKFFEVLKYARDFVRKRANKINDKLFERVKNIHKQQHLLHISRVFEEILPRREFVEMIKL